MRVVFPGMCLVANHVRLGDGDIVTPATRVAADRKLQQDQPQHIEKPEVRDADC